MSTYLGNLILTRDLRRHEDSHIVLALSENIVGGCQELDVSYLEARFL